MQELPGIHNYWQNLIRGQSHYVVDTTSIIGATPQTIYDQVICAQANTFAMQMSAL